MLGILVFEADSESEICAYIGIAGLCAATTISSSKSMFLIIVFFIFVFAFKR